MSEDLNFRPDPRAQPTPEQDTLFSDERAVELQDKGAARAAVALAGIRDRVHSGEPFPSAERAHQPSQIDAERARETRGVGGIESELIGGLERPVAHPTPGVTPAAIRHATDLKDEATGRHSARNPSPLKGSKNTGSLDVAEIKSRHAAVRRNAAETAKPDTVAPPQLPSTPQEPRPDAKPQTDQAQGSIWLDASMLKS